MSSRALHVPTESNQWTVVRDWARLDDVCLGIWDCPHSTPKLATNGPLVVRSQDIRTGVFKTEEAARVTEKTYKERIARAEPLPGDLLYSREGTYFGIAAEMITDERVCLGQRMVLIRPDRSTLNSRFLRMWLNSPVLARHIHGFRDGTVAERLNMPTIRGLPVPRFTISEQGRIAELLGRFDDAIELNRSMNNTLEAISQEIFRDWFVEFGPTRAKVEGRAPYLASELWDLFPHALDNDEIPVGWDIRKLEEFLELAYGKSLPAKNRNAGNVAVYGSGGRAGTHDAALVEGPAVIVGRKGTIGSLYWEDGSVFPIDTVFYVVPRIGSMLFSYHLLCVQPLNDMNTDAAVPGLNRNNVYRLEFPQPASVLISAFDEVVGPLWSLRGKNLKEIEALGEVRDFLLPKLMSGEIRLDEAEKAVENVA